MPRPRAAAVAGFAVVAALALLPFFWSTTFFTDDHLLLAFARYAPNPLVAFVRDSHGGEFYRPLSMSLWWLLARIGHGTIWPFAIAGAALHLLVAVQVAWLLRALGGSRAAAWSAAAFFWLSPETREAALWAAAFPDWLGTALVLGSLLAVLRARRAAALALATCAYLTKESAIVLPALALLVLAVQKRGVRAALRAGWRELAWLSAPAVAYLLARRQILGGWGGTGDERAPFAGKLLQVASGLVHVVAGSDIFPEPFAWGAGMAVLAVAALSAVRLARAGEPRAWLGPVFAGIAVLPLFAGGWIIGARYFYLPAVGLALLVGEAIGGAAAPWRIAGLVGMLALGAIQTSVRHDDVRLYDRRVEAARRAVADGVAHGHFVFHIAGGIKDLDLAVKEAPELRDVEAAEKRLLVLGDVPASFVALPGTLGSGADFLLASPPLPPSGAYRFGAQRVVGLARRGDEPTLEELLQHFPDTRFIRLRPTATGGRVVARDVTDEIRSGLD
jgi:hypothetical protein